MKRALLDVEPWRVTLHGRRRRSRIPASITRAERAIETERAIQHCSSHQWEPQTYSELSAECSLRRPRSTSGSG